ncbi:MAG: hypothetical protein AAF675_09800 [Pseudomonadota bacterium]
MTMLTWISNGVTSAGGAAVGSVAPFLRDALTIHGQGFAERLVERALKIQIALLLFLVLLSPFDALGLKGIGLSVSLGALLLIQAAFTWLALHRLRRRDPIFGAGLYALLAAITFIEAKRYAGLVGAVFALEAVLALVALWYAVALVRHRYSPRRDVQHEAEVEGVEAPA